MTATGTTHTRTPLRRARRVLTAWMAHAACKDPVTGYPARDPDDPGKTLDMHPTKGDEEGTAKAKAVCAACPVTASCLTHALTHGEDEGVWGGTTEEERRAMRRRARKVTAAAGGTQVIDLTAVGELTGAVA